MNLKKISVLASFVFFIFNGIIAQNRAEKPIQVQLNLSGVLYKVGSKAIAKKKASKWEIPGISAGYHFNERFYLGYAFHPNRNLLLEKKWSYANFSNDVNITLNHNTADAHTLEGRIFPFDFDLYISAFATHIPKTNFLMETEPIENNTFALGENNYEGNTFASWNHVSVSTVGLGLGYNYVHHSGFSLTAGLGVPLIFKDPVYENISLDIAEPIDDFNTAADLDSGVKAIEDASFNFPIQLQLSIGWNFGDGNCNCPKF